MVALIAGEDVVAIHVYLAFSQYFYGSQRH
jgi:hypothetical protein